MKKEKTPEFPNGFTSFIETYHELAVWITAYLDSGNNPDLIEYYKTQGISSLWELTQHLAFKFETKYKDEEWGIDKDYFDTLESFFQEELQKYLKEREALWPLF